MCPAKLSMQMQGFIFSFCIMAILFIHIAFDSPYVPPEANNNYCKKRKEETRAKPSPLPNHVSGPATSEKTKRCTDMHKHDHNYCSVGSCCGSVQSLPDGDAQYVTYNNRVDTWHLNCTFASFKKGQGLKLFLYNAKTADRRFYRRTYCSVGNLSLEQAQTWEELTATHDFHGLQSLWLSTWNNKWWLWHDPDWLIKGF